MTIRIQGVATLTYYYYPEAYRIKGESEQSRDSIDVQASADEGGALWEFYARTVYIGGGTLVMEFYPDSVQAFSDVPELFARIAEVKPSTLEEFRTLLDAFGARDKTQRTRPHGV